MWALCCHLIHHLAQDAIFVELYKTMYTNTARLNLFACRVDCGAIRLIRSASAHQLVSVSRIKMLICLRIY